MDFNPYKVLNVDQGADPEFITNAYRYMSKKNHPDVNKAPDAAAKMRDINRAYDMLKDPAERRKVDEQLAREKTASSSGRPTGSSYNSSTARPSAGSSYTSPRRPAPSSTPNNGPLDGLWERVQRGANKATAANNTTSPRQGEPKPTPPNDKTLYLYKKSLVDDVSKKTLRVSVYYESARGTKVCEIFSSAPDARGKVISGTVYFHSEELYDFVLGIEEAGKAFDYTESPIQVESDHVVYWRRIVQGVSQTFLGIEIIKKNRSASKEALFLLGEKTASGGIDGVAAPQTAKQVQQLARIMGEALVAMRV